MNPQNLFNLFGYSELSPEIKQLFKELHIPSRKEKMLVCWRTYESAKLRLSLVFRAKNNFFCDYGPHQKAYSKSYEEAFLEEVYFGEKKDAVKQPYTLPWNLVYGDKPETVKEKLNIRPSDSSTGGYGPYLGFYSDLYYIFTAFDKTDKLIWMRVKPLELSYKRRKQLAKSLKEQNKNIHAIDPKQLAKLNTQLPTKKWKKRKAEGDDMFTAQNIKDTETLLAGFTANLATAAEQLKANAVYATIKKVVNNINKLNDKHESFIETLEREELVDYIHRAVRLTGFSITDNTDLTEEWREW
ncbi:MAG: hypothetical protein JNK27_03880 [Chitinophagaceae bacterium]|nr:hypothetical protein [Chitinophagaceae bacterium]